MTHDECKKLYDVVRDGRIALDGDGRPLKALKKDTAEFLAKELHGTIVESNLTFYDAVDLLKNITKLNPFVPIADVTRCFFCSKKRTLKLEDADHENYCLYVKTKRLLTTTEL